MVQRMGGGRERGRAQSRGASSQQHPRPPRIAHPVEHRRVWLKAHRQAQGRLQLLPGHGSRVCDGHGGQQRGAPSRSKFCRGSRGPWTAPRRAALVGRCKFPARIWLPGEAATAPGSRSSTGAPCARPPLRRLPGVRRQLQLRHLCSMKRITGHIQNVAPCVKDSLVVGEGVMLHVIGRRGT